MGSEGSEELSGTACMLVAFSCNQTASWIAIGMGF